MKRANQTDKTGCRVGCFLIKNKKKQTIKGEKYRHEIPWKNFINSCLLRVLRPSVFRIPGRTRCPPIVVIPFPAN